MNDVFIWEFVDIAVLRIGRKRSQRQLYKRDRWHAGKMLAVAQH